MSTLEASLASLGISGPYIGAARAFAASATVAVPSPARAAGNPAASIQSALATVDFCGVPLSPVLRRLSAATSLASWIGMSSAALLAETSAYVPATAFVPLWIAATPRTSGALAASTPFLNKGVKIPPKVPFFDVPWGCFPELRAAVSSPFWPPYNGEAKSATSSGETASRPLLWDEVLTYSMLGMLGSYFRDVPAHNHRFYRRAPYAFALAAFAHVGYIVAVEWVGKLIATVVSEPFFLGSPAHEAAVTRLPGESFDGDFVDVPVESMRLMAWAPRDVRRPHVLWRVETHESASGDGCADESFIKIIRGEGFDAPYFRQLFAVYAALHAALSDRDDPPPPAIVPAHLLCGAGEVGVRMECVPGRDAVPADLAVGGCAVMPVARAIAWLARHQLLYVDLRPPNVRIDTTATSLRVSLVDYDDVVIVPQALADAAALRVALVEEPHAHFAHAEEAPGALPAVLEEVCAEFQRTQRKG